MRWVAETVFAAVAPFLRRLVLRGSPIGQRCGRRGSDASRRKWLSLSLHIPAARGYLSLWLSLIPRP